MSAESGFPLVTFGDPDQMVRMPEIDFRVDLRAARGGEKVGDEWKWVSVLFRDLVESAVIHAKTKRTVLFLDEKDRSTVWRSGLTNESGVEMLVDELTESPEFERGKGIDGSWGRWLISFQVECQVVGTMWSEAVGFCVAEDVGELVVLGGNTREVRCRRWIGGGGGGSSKMKTKLGGSRKLACAGKRSSIDE